VAEQLRLLKIRDVCVRLSMGRSYVYRLIQTQVLRSVRVGGARRVLTSDLEDFMLRLREEDGNDDGS
jgi:excisionase family DNA binding protein